MNTSLLIASLGLGLASGIHCTAMCGGIVIGLEGAQPLVPRARLWRRQAALNLGRITGYAAMGAAAGALGAGALAAGVRDWQTTLHLIASVLLVLLGLHVAGLPGPLAFLERLGAPLWRRVQPLAARLMAMPGTPATFGLGMLWGLLPCGLIYGALAVSTAAGGAIEGAAAMAAFGLGTAPWLLAGGVAAARLRAAMRHRAARLAAGVTVFASGLWGLAHAAAAADHVKTLLCL